jgi:formylglycine-generating enzyme required for sulfatase activity
MKRLLGILLVLGVLGCGSKKDASTPAKTPDAAAKNASTPDQLALGDPLVNSVGMVLVPIPAGKFMMGDESKHSVTITKPFHLGAFEVTQEQYEKVMGKNPSYFKGPNNPVELVSWKDAVEFCRKLSQLPKEKAAGHVYRLPTEAEWEYACRAGTTTKFSFGDDESQLGQYAWFDENSGEKTHPVGEKKPNAWGLHDMHGNVFEWCQDWHGDYPSEPVTDPTGPTTGSDRVFRGGCCSFLAGYCRSGFREWYYPADRAGYLGFRLARGPSASK